MESEFNSIAGVPARFITGEEKLTDKVKETYLNSFEEEAMRQYKENKEKFGDFYRMYDNELSTIELRDFAPVLSEMQGVFEKYDIPSNIYHYDLIGRVIKAFVGKLADMEDKFIITDLGEHGKNEYLQSVEDLFFDSLKGFVDIAVQRGMAKEGIDPNTAQQFESEEQQQQYMQMLQEIEQKYSPQSALEALNKGFKSTPVKWASATLEKDKEMLNFKDIYRDCIKNFLLSGTCSTITRIFEETYKKYPIDSRQLFHSKDIGKKHLQDYNYAGELRYLNDTQVIEDYGDYLTAKEIESILGGKNAKEKSDNYDSEFGETSPSKFIDGNFFSQETVPYAGYRHAKMMQRIEDMSGEPMGYTRRMGEDGSFVDSRSYIQREGGFNFSYNNVHDIENRFVPNNNIFQITDVYFKMYEYVGFYYHNTEEGFPTIDIVTKDINHELLKEKGIKQIYKKTYKEATENEYTDTIIWHVRPYVYRGVKINSPNIKKPLYPIFEKLDMQITGENDFDVKLPISGFIGDCMAAILEPYQHNFNVSNNQIRQLVEKELGMFFSIDLMRLPASIRENEDVEDIMMNMRNMAKSTGMFPTVSNPDDIQNGGNAKNMFGVHNVSHASEIQTRMQLADYWEAKCYAAAGLNMQQEIAETKYSTAEGIKMSNETMSDQIAHIFEDFNSFERADQIQHINIAQFCQSMGHDSSVYYTKDDASIQYLNFAKENNIPFAKLGITVTGDSKRRKVFEQVKGFLLNNNTLNADVKSLVSLMTSDSMSPLLDAANEARQHAEASQAQDHQRKMQQVQAASQAEDENNQRNWERDEITNERDRDNKLKTAQISVLGFVNAGADETDKILNRLDKAGSAEREDTKIANSYEINRAKIDQGQSKMELDMTLAEKKVEQKDRELDLREQAMKSREYTSEINKN